jgi:hypothetical protein
MENIRDTLWEEAMKPREQIMLVESILALLLLGCAYHPQSFDSTRLAEVQDSCITGLLPVSRLHQFDAYVKAQEAVVPTNLTARQHELQGDTALAEKQARELTRDGWWVEGYSYLEYCRRAWR